MEKYSRLRSWVNVRNVVVHGVGHVEPKQAREIKALTEYVDELMTTLKSRHVGKHK